MLKKKICVSRRLAALSSDSARLLYTWLIPHLDIEGRFSADPDVLKGQVFPRLKHLTSAKIEELLRDIAYQQLIIRYENDGDRFLQLRHFAREQNLRKDREKESNIPPPEKCKIIDGLDEVPGELPADSGLTPAQVKLREVKLREDNAPREASRNFKIFWEFYPYKKSKGQAEKAFIKINPNEQLLETMLSKIEQAKKSKNWLKNDGEFIPHPATWLNARGWEDEEIGQGQHPHYHEKWKPPE